MNSVANENEITGKRVPHLEITRHVSPPKPDGQPVRLEIAWQTAPEQCVAIANVTGQCAAPNLSLLAPGPAAAGPHDCCHL